MKFYILIFSISIHIYKSQLCEEMKSCYECSISKYNCSWYKNSCISPLLNESYINNNISLYLSHPFISGQYKCINNEKDIELFNEINIKNISISFNIKDDKSDEIKYHIYCFKYIIEQNIRLMINYNEENKINILDISIYDNITNTDIKINPKNINIINIQTNYFCLKITYLTMIKELNNLISFYIINYNNPIKEEQFNLMSYIILFSLILIVFLALSLFIIWHKKSSNTMKKIIITSKSKRKKNNNSPPNNKSIDSNYSKDKDEIDQSEYDQSNCSELQEKYFELSKDSFVEYNYETIDSFVHNLHDKDKKDVYLKAIIKTIPSFIISKSNSDFIGIFCCFCESRIKLKDKICFINCGHIFHYDCIYQQIITNEEYKCIICKENIII